MNDMIRGRIPMPKNERTAVLTRKELGREINKEKTNGKIVKAKGSCEANRKMKSKRWWRKKQLRRYNIM
jgi:t-SNARE complex subunit (syntaxin)